MQTTKNWVVGICPSQWEGGGRVVDEDWNVLIYSIAYVTKQYLMCCFIFFGYYHLCSEVGANSRRVVRHIPDEVLNNAELQDAVRQVKNVRICWSKKCFKPSGNLYVFFVAFIFIQCNLKQWEINNDFKPQYLELPVAVWIQVVVRLLGHKVKGEISGGLFLVASP